MRSAVSGLHVVFLLVVLTACNGNGTVTTAAVPATSSTVDSSTSPSTLPPVVECPGAGEFEEGGGIADVGGEGSDSSNLGQISWETNDRCESFAFGFETSEGAPATTVPDIRIDHLASFQVIRITMDIDAAVVTDQLVETALVDRLYVVRALDEAILVDLHLIAPAAARATIRSSPATLTLELRPGFVGFEGGSTIAEEIVVVSPPEEGSVESPVQVEGYTRTFGADVGIVGTRGGAVIDETSTTSADLHDVETWSQFRAELDLTPGDVTVFVGGGGAEDVIIDLTVS